jgi:DNA-directed RNA polymerase subunit RPC12/RpoP
MRHHQGYIVRRVIKITHTILWRSKISLVFGDIHPNPHIKAFWEEKEEIQIEKLQKSNLEPVKITGNIGELRRCPYCGSEGIIGHGVQHNGSHPKRKKCKDCGRTFNTNKGTVFY